MQTIQTAVWETGQTAVLKLPFEWVYPSAVTVPNAPSDFDLAEVYPLET